MTRRTNKSPTALVRAEWKRRVEAEYRSAARTQHLTLWLTQIAASPDLIRAGLRIADDEMVHAEMSHEVFCAAGGQGGPSLTRESLELSRRESEPLEHDVARAGVEIFCLGETVAVPLFKELRAECTVAVARRALDRILKDEVRHRAFGWDLLGWLMEGPMAESLRSVIEADLASWFASLRSAYAPPNDNEVTPDERAWGLMPIAIYRRCVDKTLVRDYIPRFAKLGFDARAAWD